MKEMFWLLGERQAPRAMFSFRTVAPPAAPVAPPHPNHAPALVAAVVCWVLPAVLHRLTRPEPPLHPLLVRLLPRPADPPPQPVRLFVVCVVIQLGILLLLGNVGPDLGALQLCFDPVRFRAIVGRWSPEQLSQFRAHFSLDCVYPLLYATLLRRRASAMLPAGRLRHCIRAAAAVGAALDGVENFLHLSALPHLSAAPDGVVLLASVAATAKWMLLLPCVALLRPGARVPPAAERARALLAALLPWQEEGREEGREEGQEEEGPHRHEAALIRAAARLALPDPTRRGGADEGSADCRADEEARLDADEEARVDALLLSPLERWARGGRAGRESLLRSCLGLEGRSKLLAVAGHVPPPPTRREPQLLPTGASLRVLVTGATGFLGAAVVRRLRAEGAGRREVRTAVGNAAVPGAWARDHILILVRSRPRASDGRARAAGAATAVTLKRKRKSVTRKSGRGHEAGGVSCLSF